MKKKRITHKIAVSFFAAAVMLSANAFAENLITEIVPKGNIGVFESTDGAEYTLKHTAQSSDRLITYKLTDLRGDLKREGRVWLKAGKSETVLNIPNLKVGWYRIRFYSGGEEITDVYCSAAVILPKEGRGGFLNSPVSIDLAGQYGNLDSAAYNKQWTEEQTDAFSKAMSLAGFGYVRERVADRGNKTSAYTTIIDHTNSLSGYGLKIMNEFSSCSTYTEDLYNTYIRAYNNGRAYRGKITAWEGTNEPDGVRTEITADMEAALFKASAIGILRSGSRAVKVSPSMYDYHSTDFMETLMQNGVMTYADAINVHSHTSFRNAAYAAFPDTIVKRARELATVYGGGKQVWVSEAGMSCEIDGDYNVSDSNQYALAKYAVTSAAESFANSGTDRHFYFLGRYYSGSDSAMGIFSKNNMPYSAYSALANLTYHLEGGRMKGVLKNLQSGMHGYVFDKGESDVCIIWNEGAEGEYLQLKTQTAARVVDLLGGREDITFSPKNEAVSIKVSDSPVIVKFSGHLSAENFYKKTYPEYGAAYGGVSVRELSDAKCIVLRQRWENPEIKNGEYVLSRGAEQKIYLDVCNLSGAAADINIVPEASGSLEITGGAGSINVGRYETKTIEYKVKVKDSFKGADEAYICFGGSLSGEALSPSAAKCSFEAAPGGYILSAAPEAEEASKWRPGTSRITLSNKDGGINVSAVGNGADDFYCYAFYQAQNVDFAESKGVYFRLNVPEEYAAKEENGFYGRVYLRTKSGASYLYGYGDFKAGETEYYVPWDKVAANGIVTGVDPKDITEIGIGFNYWDKTIERMEYDILGLSFYSYETADDESLPRIKLSGIKEGAVLRENQKLSVKAEIPEGLENIKVYLNYLPYEDFSLEGGEAEIRLSGLSEGAVNITVSGEWRYGMISRSSINFYSRAREDYGAEGAFFN